jgi:anti-anti-sigma regulatory factor/putative methionine-R-sulfoxide reductase with GAF domain
MSTEEPKNETDRIAVLAGIATEVTSALDEEALSIAVQRAIDRLIQVEYSGLFFFDPEIGRLRMLYARGFTKEERAEAESTAMDRHPGWVFKSRKMLHVPDVEADPENRTSSSPRSFAVRSRLHLPVLFRNECVGVFGLSSSKPDYFTDIHIATLLFLASMTGVVYSNLKHIRAITAQIELVRRQRTELRELSAPILMVGKGALLLPVIGRVDAARAELMQEKLLGAIALNRARSVILDLTGMAIHGSDAMDALLRIAKAAALMGARCVLSGITPKTALTMVGLDVPLRSGDIFGTVEGALASVLRDA